MKYTSNQSYSSIFLSEVRLSKFFFNIVVYLSEWALTNLRASKKLALLTTTPRSLYYNRRYILKFYWLIALSLANNVSGYCPLQTATSQR